MPGPGAEPASHLEQSRSQGIVTLRLNRPDRLNAFSDPMLNGLMAALEAIGPDPEVGAVVLAGAPPVFRRR